MISAADPAAVLSLQRYLRAELLDRSSTVPWAPARDLTAHLLLSLEDPDSCWKTSVNWLQDHFDVDRVDGGLCGGASGWYVLGSAQARRRDVLVPSVKGIQIPLTSAVLCSLAGTRAPTVFEDINQASIMGEQLRSELIRVGTRVKIASSLHYEKTTFGLVCMDRVHRSDRLTSTLYDRFQLVTATILSQILGASLYLERSHDRVIGPDVEERLTPAERKVLLLMVKGSGYKAIAKQLGRSVHTVDHQLRSIRAKLKVRTNLQLIGMMSKT